MLFVCICLFLNLIALFILIPHDNGSNSRSVHRFPRSTPQTTMDPAKLAKLQALSAANRIGEPFAVAARSSAVILPRGLIPFSFVDS